MAYAGGGNGNFQNNQVAKREKKGKRGRDFRNIQQIVADSFSLPNAL
jgi:hypothetical protein